MIKFDVGYGNLPREEKQSVISDFKYTIWDRKVNNKLMIKVRFYRLKSQFEKTIMDGI